MKINNISSISFSAKLDGDLKAIKKMALSSGLPENLYKRTIEKMQDYFPDADVTIKLYNRILKINCTRDGVIPTLLQKVKIIKNHEILDEMLVKADGKYGVTKYLSAVRKMSEKLYK